MTMPILMAICQKMMAVIQVPQACEPMLADPASDRKITTVGVSWKPLVNVALKADYNRIRNAAGTGVNQVNVALGFYY